MIKRPAKAPRLVAGGVEHAGAVLKAPASDFQRRCPVGAEVVPGGGAHFRVWAPKSRFVIVQLSREARFQADCVKEVALEAESEGFFSGFVAEAGPGTFYKFKLERGSFPDPASRFQPEGPHG